MPFCTWSVGNKAHTCRRQVDAANARRAGGRAHGGGGAAHHERRIVGVVCCEADEQVVHSICAPLHAAADLRAVRCGEGGREGVWAAHREGGARQWAWAWGPAPPSRAGAESLPTRSTLLPTPHHASKGGGGGVPTARMDGIATIRAPKSWISMQGGLPHEARAIEGCHRSQPANGTSVAATARLRPAAAGWGRQPQPPRQRSTHFLPW